MESCRAKSSENKSKNCKNHIFHVCFSFCGYLLWAPAPQKQGGNVRYSPKTTWSYSILLCMKTVLQWFRGQSGTWWPRNQTLKNVRADAFVLVGTGFNSLNTQKRTRTLTGTPIFIFSRSPVNYTSETPWNSFLQTMKSFRVKSSENKSKHCENHVFSRVFTCTSLLFLTKSSNIEVVHQHMPTSC